MEREIVFWFLDAETQNVIKSLKENVNLWTFYTLLHFSYSVMSYT